ncbi:MULTISPECIES: hypothetical protein [Pseudarthrobacter]|uniref:hypothetical protein n=1 Tax=Pseudarthrobacter TaxID=1742993 RepID=UPI0013D97020|nr:MULTISPECIES: hypothetical protein [Pseudarthrobacter]MDQ0000101.1 hypothetical protein [Pseudarthrobacter sulfonivorans]
MADMQSSKESDDARTRALLAIVVVSLGLVGMAMVSATALWLASAQNRPEMARLVFASILPLLGTWVGTVLAFYFARENMSAATENTARLLGLQSSTPVTAVMVPKARMITHTLASGADVRTVGLVEIYNRMMAAGVARIPILDAAGAVLYTVHKSVLVAFAGSIAPPKEPAALTEQMHHLLADPDRKRLVEAMGFVGPSALIEDARNRMRSIPDCNDVFVTSSGKKTDPVIGWLTNTDLAGAE